MTELRPAANGDIPETLDQLLKTFREVIATRIVASEQSTGTSGHFGKTALAAQHIDHLVFGELNEDDLRRYDFFRAFLDQVRGKIIVIIEDRQKQGGDSFRISHVQVGSAFGQNSGALDAAFPCRIE
jgi:hypothetical protein